MENSAGNSEGQQPGEQTKDGKNSLAAIKGSENDIGAQTGGCKRGRGSAIHRGSEGLAFVVETADRNDKTVTAPCAWRTGP
jgi:hypothetical protein